MTTIMIRRLVPLVTVAVAGLAVTTSAAVADTAVNEQLPAPEAGPSPCNPLDTLSFTGDQHLLVHFSRDASGGYVGHFHLNLDDMHGTDVTTGTKYEFVVTGNFDAPFTTNGATVYDATEHYAAISDGSAPNFETQEVVHMTFNPDGVLTANVTDVSRSCTG